MTGNVLLILINSGVVMILLWHIHIIFRGLHHLKDLQHQGVTVRIWDRLPMPILFKKSLKRLLFYSEALNKTHLSKEDKLVFHVIWNIFIPLGCIWGLINNPSNLMTYVTVLFASILGKYSLLIHYRRQRALVFNKNAYRLYKFLHNQLSAGVQPKESMMSLSRIVQEPFLRQRLQALGSMYAQTLDFNLSFEEISRYYEGPEVDAFRMAMSQGITLGNNLNTLKKQEELMFSKYMSYLHLETERQKLRTFIVVSIFCAIIIFMIGLPLWMELHQAIDIIFTS